MLTKTTMTTTTSNTSPTTGSGASFPHDLIESIKLNWNVMTLTIINTVLLFLNLILVCILIYAVYANSRRVIRFFKNYVRFYSQVLSPPAYLESALGPLEDTGKTASTSSSQTNTSYSTSDEINPNNNNNNNSTKQSASTSKSLIVRQLNSAVKNTAANNIGNQNPKTSNTAVSSRVKKIERTTTRTKNGGELVSQNSSAMISRNSRAGGIERETSTESLRLKMRRSESWDAKNKIYLNSSYLSASVAEKTTNRVVNNGIYNYDF